MSEEAKTLTLEQEMEPVIKHIDTFASVYNGHAEVYSYRHDEALRDNASLALAMRRDGYVYSLLQERILPTTTRKWDITVEDERDETQAYVKKEVRRVVSAIPRFTKMRRYLLEALWYGNYGSQIRWERREDLRSATGEPMWGVAWHTPVNGDKIQYEFGGAVPGVFINAMTRPSYPSDSIRMADRAPILMLNRPEWRRQFVIHQHEVDDADYFEGEMAGAIGGVGIRSRVYWLYHVRRDLLSWALTAMSKAGTLGMLIFWFESGNANAKTEAMAAAKKADKDRVLVLPKPPGMGNQQTWGVEHIPADTGGVEAITRFIFEFCDTYLERIVVGQSMSSGADNESGLGGSGRSKLAEKTKHALLVFDAQNLDETITTDLIQPIIQLNFPWVDFPVRFTSIIPDPEAQEKLSAVTQVASLGVEFKKDEVRALTGLSEPTDDDEVIGGQQQQQGMPQEEGGDGIQEVMSELSSIEWLELYAGSWEPHTIQRGPRKGRTAYRNSETGEIRETAPGSHSSGGAQVSASTAGKFRRLLARVGRVPRDIRERATKFATSMYAKMAKKYGPTGATLVMAGMVAVLPIPVPGTSLVPIAIAEAVKGITKLFRRSSDQPALQNYDDNVIDLRALTAAITEAVKSFYAHLGESSDGVIDAGSVRSKVQEFIDSQDALQTYAAEDWEPHTIAAGPRKGQSVYRNRNTGEIRDEVPNEAEAKDDPPKADQQQKPNDGGTKEQQPKRQRHPKDFDGRSDDLETVKKLRDEFEGTEMADPGEALDSVEAFKAWAGDQGKYLQDTVAKIVQSVDANGEGKPTKLKSTAAAITRKIEVGHGKVLKHVEKRAAVKMETERVSKWMEEHDAPEPPERDSFPDEKSYKDAVREHIRLEAEYDRMNDLEADLINGKGQKVIDDSEEVVEKWRDEVSEAVGAFVEAFDGWHDEVSAKIDADADDHHEGPLASSLDEMSNRLKMESLPDENFSSYGLEGTSSDEFADIHKDMLKDIGEWRSEFSEHSKPHRTHHELQRMVDEHTAKLKPIAEELKKTIGGMEEAQAALDEHTQNGPELESEPAYPEYAEFDESILDLESEDPNDPEHSGEDDPVWPALEAKKRNDALRAKHEAEVNARNNETEAEYMAEWQRVRDANDEASSDHEAKAEVLTEQVAALKESAAGLWSDYHGVLKSLGEGLRSHHKNLHDKHFNWQQQGTDAPSANGEGVQQYSEGRWVTMGGKSGDEGRRGGSPVFIKDGRIEKGHHSLVGKKPSEISDKGNKGKAFGVRKANQHQREYDKAKIVKEARAEGLHVGGLHSLAKDVLDHDTEQAERVTRMLRDARKLSEALGYGSLQGMQARNARGTLDAAGVKGLDDVAARMQEAYPELFHSEVDTADRLFDLLVDGNRDPMSEEEAYRKAFDMMMESRHRSASSDDDEIITFADDGRWVTIGAQEGEDGEKKGGSPVFIKDGKITKGHASLVGKAPHELGKKKKKEEKPEAHREKPSHGGEGVREPEQPTATQEQPTVSDSGGAPAGDKVADGSNVKPLALTRAEIASLLANPGDRYHDAKHPKDELKGHHKDSGDPIYGHRYAPEHFTKSDATGRSIRHYVKLPNGQTVHPDELRDAIARGRVKVKASAEEKALSDKKEAWRTAIKKDHQFTRKQLEELAMDGKVDIPERSQILREHRGQVEKEITRGGYVPPEVLADYPDLAAKYWKKEGKAPEKPQKSIDSIDGSDKIPQETTKQPEKIEETKMKPVKTESTSREPHEKVKRSSTSGQGDITGDLIHTDTLNMPQKGKIVQAKIEIIKLDTPVNGMGYAMVADSGAQIRWKLYKSENDARDDLAKSKGAA